MIPGCYLNEPWLILKYEFFMILHDSGNMSGISGVPVFARHNQGDHRIEHKQLWDSLRVCFISLVSCDVMLGQRASGYAWWRKPNFLEMLPPADTEENASHHVGKLSVLSAVPVFARRIKDTIR